MEKEAEEAFSNRVEEVKFEVTQESKRYQNLLTTIGAFFNASASVSPNEFNDFVRGLGTESSFPGVKGVAYAQRVDGANQPQVLEQARSIGAEFDEIPLSVEGEQALVLYVDPPSDQVPRGLNAYTVPGGREGLTRSLETGNVISSVPMQYTINGVKTSGYVLAYPVVKGAPLASGVNDESPFTGWVLAFVDPTEIYPALPSTRDISLQVKDVESNRLVIEETAEPISDMSSTFQFSVGQRNREVVVAATPAFLNSVGDQSNAARAAVLVANIQIVIMLLGLVVLMQRTRRKREVKLTHQAAHDVLTGLPNRYFLEEWLDHKVKNSGKVEQKVAVLFIDLDGFKAINDTLGHQKGDEFLIAIAQRLQKEVREKDILARLGGDEFIVVLDEVGDESQAMRIAERLIEVVRFPVMLDSGPVCVSASIGIAISQLDPSSDSSSVIRFADAAMYAAKENKDERIRVFDHKLKSIVDGRHEVESSIKGASERSEIVDVLQPLIDVQTGHTVGYEALCRWDHPIFGILNPGQFLDAAKVTGEIIEIDRWMSKHAFENALNIYKATGEKRRVWINLSVRHLLQGEFYRHVVQALKETDATADMLGVEIEEEVFKIDNGLLYPFLNELRELGILIAFDDFGSEDMSLQALKNYQYDVIKLDRSIVHEFAKKPAISIVPAVVELAHERGMEVVASGVETPEELQAVIDVGCNIVQGYVFSPGQSYSDLVDLAPGYRWEMPLGVKRDIKRQKIDGVIENYTDAKEA